MDEVEQNFLQTQSKKPLIWLRYIDDVFFIWTHGVQELEIFFINWDSFTPNLCFIHAASNICIPFLDLTVKLIERGYPESVTKKEMKKVPFSKQGQKSKKVEKEYHLL